MLIMISRFNVGKVEFDKILTQLHNSMWELGTFKEHDHLTKMMWIFGDNYLKEIVGDEVALPLIDSPIIESIDDLLKEYSEEQIIDLYNSMQPRIIPRLH